MKKTEIGLIPEDWKVKKISEFAKITTGNKNTQDKISTGKYPFFVRSQIVERINSYSFDGEAVLTAGDGVGVGKVFHYINDKFDFHQRVYAISQFDSKVSGFYFFKYFQSNFYNRIMQMTAKSSVDSVRMETIADMYIPLPPLAEQEAIANALSDADAWIEKLEQLIAKKRLIKQGAMQTLLTPKDGWEVKKLGEVGKCLRGVSYSGDTDLYGIENENSIKLLRSNNVYNSKVVFENIQNVNKHKVKEHQLIKRNDILICMANGSKELVGKSGFCGDEFISDNYTFGAFMGGFRLHENSAVPYFIFNNFLSKNYRNYIDLLLSGSSINNLKPSDIEQIEIPFPSLSEQERIATILSDMDVEIEALEQQLGKARHIKQGMMQELLTGRTRLV